VRILFSSHSFSPNIGGIETVSEILAAEFSRAGHEVRLVTQTEADDQTPRPYAVIRRPGLCNLLRQVRWCEVFFQNNISLQVTWPLVFFSKPLVITTQAWLPRDPWGWLKRQVMRFADRRVYISEAVARHISLPGPVIPNPIRDDIFRTRDEVPRDREVLFLRALAESKGARQATIVGSGPEEPRLKQLAHDLGLGDRVVFAGARKGDVLAREMNRHRILVVPSVWEEPFGVVAVEGIACGCYVVASDGGGLPEAVGPCGTIFPRGDAPALAALLDLFGAHSPGIPPAIRALHLERFRQSKVAASYLELFARLA